MSSPEHPGTSLTDEDQLLQVNLQWESLMDAGKTEAAWVVWENFKQKYLENGHTKAEFEDLQFNARNELARMRGQLEYPGDHIDV